MTVGPQWPYWIPASTRGTVAARVDADRGDLLREQVRTVHASRCGGRRHCGRATAPCACRWPAGRSWRPSGDRRIDVGDRSAGDRQDRRPPRTRPPRPGAPRRGKTVRRRRNSSAGGAPASSGAAGPGPARRAGRRCGPGRVGRQAGGELLGLRPELVGRRALLAAPARPARAPPARPAAARSSDLGRLAPRAGGLLLGERLLLVGRRPGPAPPAGARAPAPASAPARRGSAWQSSSASSASSTTTRPRRSDTMTQVSTCYPLLGPVLAAEGARSHAVRKRDGGPSTRRSAGLLQRAAGLPLVPRDRPVVDVGAQIARRWSSDLHDVARLGEVEEPGGPLGRHVDAAVRHVAVALLRHRPRGGVHELAAVGDADGVLDGRAVAARGCRPGRRRCWSP